MKTSAVFSRVSVTCKDLALLVIELLCYGNLLTYKDDILKIILTYKIFVNQHINNELLNWFLVETLVEGAVDEAKKCALNMNYNQYCNKPC